VTYRDDGWISWPDWLGNGKERVAWKSFTDGRVFVRGLGLKRQEGWYAFSKSGQRPSDIPSAPNDTYRDDGWISYPDWLGFEGRVSAKDMLPFAVGRAYARKLKLKNQSEWVEWSKSGQRPSNIPAAPDKTYRGDGWISMPDWLGYGSEGGAAASRSSSSSSSAAPAPTKTKKKRKRRPTKAPVLLKVQQRTKTDLKEFIADIHTQGKVADGNCTRLAEAVAAFCRGSDVSAADIETTPTEAWCPGDVETQAEWAVGSPSDSDEEPAGNEVKRVKKEVVDHELNQGSIPDAMDMVGPRIIVTVDDDGSTHEVLDVNNSAVHVQLPYVDGGNE
jgi:hypothetical protein